MEKKNPLPLNEIHVNKTELLLNRSHIFLHSIGLLCLFYYRITTLAEIINNHEELPSIWLFSYVLVFVSELILSFIWLLSLASKWRPVARSVHPERLPNDKDLPSIDVFICTADPKKEPCLEVMNTVISALALDYPPDKLHIYLSDDGSCSATFRAFQEACKFSKWWIRFCKKYDVKDRCPEAYFSAVESDCGKSNSSEFVAEKNKIEKRYEEFKDCLEKMVDESSFSISRDHPPLIEVIGNQNDDTIKPDQEEMPLIVYVAREKRPSHPHHFKAGALNVLLRVSAMISNSPYILGLDCDMYCNDPSSARQAMCFHLDSKLSRKLAFVQFPQTFHNISKKDIYDGQLRYVWPKWKGMDGLRGPILSGTCFYIKRNVLYGKRKIQEDVDLIELQKSFGLSNEFINSVYRNYRLDYTKERKSMDDLLQKEIQLLASCNYDSGTKWGKEIGFRYISIVEDYFTSFNLHAEGWISVYLEPSRPCFLGASPVSLNEILVQNTRWCVGLWQIVLSRFSPLLYGPFRMSILQSMCYAEFAYRLLHFVSLYCLAIVPQICLLHGLALYPEVSSPYFFIFFFLFLSSQLKHIQEVFSTGHSIKTWIYEQRFWMIRPLTAYFYSFLNILMEKFGLRKASFLPTNKMVDEEQNKRYQMGVYDFQASALFMVPVSSLYMLNVASLIVCFFRNLQSWEGDRMFVQGFIAVFVVVMNSHFLEGMVLRKDEGRVSASVCLVSAVVCAVVLCSSLGTSLVSLDFSQKF